MPMIGLCKGFWHVSQQEGYLNPLVSNPLFFWAEAAEPTMTLMKSYSIKTTYWQLSALHPTPNFHASGAPQHWAACQIPVGTICFWMFAVVFLKVFLPLCFFLWHLIYFWCCGIMGMRDQMDNLSKNISNRHMCVWERERETEWVLLSEWSGKCMQQDGLPNIGWVRQTEAAAHSLLKTSGNTDFCAWRWRKW